MTQKQPNIIYINVDDMGWTDPTFMGSTYHETPNIDRLAAEGMVFTNAYAPAANCAPSRACCLTGKYPPRHGIYTVGKSDRGESKHRKLIPTPNTLSLEAGTTTMASLLHDAGYKTCHVGKFHVGADPKDYGFDINIGGGHWGQPQSYFSPYGGPDNLPAEADGEYLTDRLGAEAITFIRDHRDCPFFLYLATYTVHGPLQAKESVIEKYRKKPPAKDHNHPVYAAMIESLDENIGRLLAVLDELGLTDQTLILFTSDNDGVYNTTKQWPLRAGKGAYYEGGIREPMIIRWPQRVTAGTTCDASVTGIDFLPTFCDAAETQSIDVDGESIMPLLTGEGAFPDRPIFWHFPVYLETGNAETQDELFRTRPGSAIRRGDWKLIEYFEDGVLEPCNLKMDIGEKQNLADAEPEKAAELHAALVDWRRKTRAPVPRPSSSCGADPRPRKGPRSATTSHPSRWTPARPDSGWR